MWKINVTHISIFFFSELNIVLCCVLLFQKKLEAFTLSQLAPHRCAKYIRKTLIHEAPLEDHLSTCLFINKFNQKIHASSAVHKLTQMHGIS